MKKYEIIPFTIPVCMPLPEELVQAVGGISGPAGTTLTSWSVTLSNSRSKGKATILANVALALLILDTRVDPREFAFTVEKT